MFERIHLLAILIALIFFSPVPAQTFPGGKIKTPENLTPDKFEFSPKKIFYDSAQTAWVSIYNDLINGDDEAYAMVQDSYGNLYVTGNCSDTGATYGWDITTIKYNSDGVQQWLVSFDGPGHGDDVPYSIAVDQHSNIYIAGYGKQSVSGTEFLTMKIDSSGTIEWYRMLANTSGSNDVAFSVAVDNNGNVFATGATFTLASGSFDLTTVKYNSAGVQQWIQRYNSPFNNEDTGENLVLDSNDNIYITGVSQEEPGNYDIITMKYNSDGVMQWVERYNGPGNSNDGGYRLALDENQNVVVTGYQTGAGTLFDILTIKYDNNGNQMWAAVYNGPVNGNDDSNALVLDPAGNIYVTGFVTGPNGTSDYATLKYTPDGALVWASFYSGPANGFEQAYGIALDNQGGVYITGYSPLVVTPYIHYEYATVKYDTSGQEQWVERYSGNSSLTYEPNVAHAIVVDNSGNVYVTGEIADESVGEDFGTIKYSQTVLPVELTGFTANAEENNVLLTWATATEKNNRGFEVQRAEVRGQGQRKNKWTSVGFVAGYGTTTRPESYTYTDKSVIEGSYNYRLKQIDFNGSYKYYNVVEVTVTTPLQFTLYQNYPNPFNPSTSIEYSIPQDGFVSLKVYTTLGQQVAELVNGISKAGTHKVIFNAERLASGVYYYRIESGSNVLVKKMQLLK